MMQWQILHLHQGWVQTFQSYQNWNLQKLPELVVELELNLYMICTELCSINKT